jgi:hypothetical protein
LECDLGAYRSDLGVSDRSVFAGLAALEGILEEVASFVGGPLIMGVGQNGSNQADDGSFVREPHTTRARV